MVTAQCIIFLSVYTLCDNDALPAVLEKNAVF